MTQQYRVHLDMVAGTATAVAADVVAVGDKTYLRHSDGSLRPADRDPLWSGDRYIVTAWHDDRAAAFEQATEELARRMQAMADLHRSCLAGKEVVHV